LISRPVQENRIGCSGGWFPVDAFVIGEQVRGLSMRCPASVWTVRRWSRRVGRWSRLPRRCRPVRDDVVTAERLVLDRVAPAWLTWTGRRGGITALVTLPASRSEARGSGRSP